MPDDLIRLHDAVKQVTQNERDKNPGEENFDEVMGSISCKGKRNLREAQRVGREIRTG